jgi:glucose-1-phosphate thymidylyltransferase
MDKLKIVIPTAGWATRMRPQTWSKPKPLVSVAGKAAIDHLLEMFKTVPNVGKAEFVIILGPHLGETQIPPFMKENHPAIQVDFVVQPVMRGQSDALSLARQHLEGPMIMCFSDTLIETDFSFLAEAPDQATAWIKQVPDPRPYGVAEVGGDGNVTRLVEKPTSLENNRVVVGCYYFPEGRDLVAAIDEQVRRGKSLKGEYFLADAINILLERGLVMRTRAVEVWLDTGTIDAILQANRYLLANGRASHTRHEKRDGVEIVPPVFIHPTARLRDSVIGPNVSIGPDCQISQARLEDSILESGVTVESASLTGSFIGRQARIRCRTSDEPAMRLNIGDNSSITL